MYAGHRRIAIGRILGLLLAIFCAGLAINSAVVSYRKMQDFNSWLDARPMEGNIDFSKPGKFKFAFHQTCQTSHGEVIYLKTQPRLDGDPEIILSRLRASLVITDNDGKQIQKAGINGAFLENWYSGEDVALTSFAPFRKGDYVATVHVETGVPELSGVEQTVYARYQLCGLEQMPAWFAGATALAAGLIGGVAAYCVAPRIRRFGFIKQNPTAASVGNEP